MADLFDIAIARKLSDGGGGGGSSDFSTAQVTITNNAEEQAVTVPMIYSDQQNGDILYGGYTLFANESVEAVVALYQGTAFFTVNSGTISATGDIETLPGPVPMCYIHGNGTITIS